MPEDDLHASHVFVVHVNFHARLRHYGIENG